MVNVELIGVCVCSREHICSEEEERCYNRVQLGSIFCEWYVFQITKANHADDGGPRR